MHYVKFDKSTNQMVPESWLKVDVMPRSFVKFMVVCALLLIIFLIYAYSSFKFFNPRTESGEAFIRSYSKRLKHPIDKSDINLAFVSCGGKYQKVETLLKSLFIFTKAKVSIFAFVEEENIPKLEGHLKGWKNFTLNILPTQFPISGDKWESMFRSCASQRLFFPNMLQDVDSLLYVDTDILFLRPIEEIWGFFSRMSNQQMAGMAYESEPYQGWYSKQRNVPYFGNAGVNSGVMLMNLTRMRQFGWYDKVITTHSKWKESLKLHDQDILNIIFHYEPEKLYIFPCSYNFRIDFCKKNRNLCQSSRTNGFSILHGNRNIFHSDGIFKCVYDAFYQYNSEGSLGVFYDILNEKLKNCQDLICGSEIFGQILLQVGDSLE